MAIPTVILCVDDEPNILALRQVVLSIAGYTVLTATNGESALQLFSMNHVDLVITDQWLPDRSGGELAWEMKRIKPDVPIILYTGMEDPPSGGEHADLVLVKGMHPGEFLAIIAKLVARSRDPGMGSS